MSNEPDEQVKNTGRAIGALDAIPLSEVHDEALAYYLNVALRLGAVAHQDRQAEQVVQAVGSFGDVFFFRARFADNTGEPVMDESGDQWISRSGSDERVCLLGDGSEASQQEQIGEPIDWVGRLTMTEDSVGNSAQFCIDIR